MQDVAFNLLWVRFELILTICSSCKVSQASVVANLLCQTSATLVFNLIDFRDAINVKLGPQAW